MPQSLYDGQDNNQNNRNQQTFSLYDSKSNIKYVTNQNTSKTRYEYVDKNGACHEFYSYEKPTTRINVKNRIIVFALIIALSLIVAIALIVGCVPRKLSSRDCSAHADFLDDRGDIFTSKERIDMISALEAFYKKTGVQAYIYTTKIANVPDEFTSEDSFYARYYPNRSYIEMNEKETNSYTQYVYDNLFDDQGHWLIVIIDMRQSSVVSNVNYRIGYCIGSKASKIVNDSLLKDFNKKAFNSTNVSWFSSYSGTGISNAINKATSKALSNTFPYTMLIIFAWIIVVFITVRALGKSVRYANDVNAYLDYVESGSNYAVNSGKSFREIKEAYLKQQEERERKSVPFAQDDRFVYIGNNAPKETVIVNTVVDGQESAQLVNKPTEMVCPYCGKSYDITEASCPYCAGDNPAV